MFLSDDAIAEARLKSMGLCGLVWVGDGVDDEKNRETSRVGGLVVDSSKVGFGLKDVSRW